MHELAPFWTSVYVPNDLISWQMHIHSWMRTRRGPEVDLLMPLLEKYISPLLAFVASTDFARCVELSVSAQMKTLILLLKALLTENMNQIEPLHLECYVIFSVTWAIGTDACFSCRLY